MKLSELIKVLRKARAEYGDVAVCFTDSYPNIHAPIAQAIKLHPYTGEHGCMNRSDPVDMVGLSTHNRNASDLVLSA